MTPEHPFAQYVRILGKGPNLSRPLTRDEARAAMSMILSGQVEPVQLGAFLCLLRVKTETPEEVAGLVEAIRATIVAPPTALAPHVDWASYAGKSRQLPYYVLAALALAETGVRVFMHGAENHTAGRVYTSEVLTALGVPVATSLDEAAVQLVAGNFSYMRLEHLSPALHRIMELRSLLGLRSPIHTVARLINPLRATLSMSAVTHPPYLPIHQASLRLLGDQNMAAFKGDGGEVERRPEKDCEVWSLREGQPQREEWPALVSGAREKEESLDLSRLKAVWNSDDDHMAEAAITGTIAIVLRHMGRAETIAQAEAAARSLWSQRNRQRFIRASA